MGRALTPPKGTIRTTQSEYHEAPTRQLHINSNIPIDVSGVAAREKQSYIFAAAIHKQIFRHKVPRSGLRAVIGNMKFALHAIRRTPHGASRVVQAKSAWLLKSRRATTLFFWLF